MSQHNITDGADPLLNYDPEIQVSAFHNDEAVFATLNHVHVSTGPGLGRDNECRICGDDIKADQGAITHDQCKTSFHLSCATKWVVSNLESNGKSTCPLCRGEIAVPCRRPNEVITAFADFYRYVQQSFTNINHEFEYLWQKIIPYFNNLEGELKDPVRGGTRVILLDFMDLYWSYFVWISMYHFQHALMQMKNTNRDSVEILRDLRRDLFDLSGTLINHLHVPNTIDFLNEAQAAGKVGERGVEYIKALVSELDVAAANGAAALAQAKWCGHKSIDLTLTEYIESKREEALDDSDISQEDGN